MLAGPMDCTPGAFRTLGKEDFKPVNPPAAQGTRCHQLAMYVIFESPIQFLPDYPDAYRSGTGLDFLKAVPATWDDTRALAGEPGRYIVMARRSGKEWYVGAMTDWEARELSVPLDFLDEGGYAAEIYKDPEGEGADLSDAELEVLEVERGHTLTMRLAPGGGCALRIYPLGKR
jgi:alpha-glucosidase